MTGPRNEVFRCPSCLGKLSPVRERNSSERAVKALSCHRGHIYPIRTGIPDLIYPRRVMGSDRKFLAQYETHAKLYDGAASKLFHEFGAKENQFRRWIAGLLPRQRAAKILEVSCGTGSNFRYLLERAGPGGRLMAVDLSSAMAEIARTKIQARSSRVTLALANGAHLPFSDESFGGVFHFGGINTFSDIPRALAEMVRVVRQGGRVVLGDEGLAPWLLDTPYGQALLRENSLYASQPPLAKLPPTVRDIHLQWVLGDAFYILSFSRGRMP